MTIKRLLLELLESNKVRIVYGVLEKQNRVTWLKDRSCNYQDSLT